MQPRSRWLLASFLVNLCVVIGALHMIIKKGGMRYVRSEVNRVLGFERPSKVNYSTTKAGVLSSLPLSARDVVFLGDSLVDFGEWGELMDSVRAKNRGVAGDTTGDVLNRLETIVAGKPGDVVLWCGVNDIQSGIAFEETALHYKTIIARILASSPEVKIWILPILHANHEQYAYCVIPLHPNVTEPTFERVDRINHFLVQMCGPRVSMVVLHLCDESGIQIRYTPDGLHLNGAGLFEVAAALKSQGLLSTF
ncbi:MAG: lipolytic protein family [Verrucomicrobia bacterium]|nr:lipolytic protein family [Verrucomicrobiota bacterium]